MIRLRIDQITEPRHLSAFLFQTRSGQDRVRMDIFTGWAGPNFSGGGGNVHRDEMKSFLINESGQIASLAAEDDLLTATVTASVSSVADDDDEANVAAVDFAIARLESQVIGGIQGSPLCLILFTRLAALNATVHGVTYQVTTLSKVSPDRQTIEFLDVSPSARPDP